MSTAHRNKREILESLFEQTSKWNYVPAAFFAHFKKEFHSGIAAINKHIDFFRYTDMDFLKIQYEHTFPKLDFIKNPKDWLDVPFYDSDFFAEPIEIVKGLVAELKRETFIIQTIYSPYMCAADSTSYDLVAKHLSKEPYYVLRGLSIIRDSIASFMSDCAKAGIDGFYCSTQGGEHRRFAHETDFENYILPFDVSLLREIENKTRFNILHICDYWLPYSSFDIFTNCPCKIVSAPTSLHNGQQIHVDDLYKKFGKPILGGMNRKKALQTGPLHEIAKEVNAVLSKAPDRFFLGADCTVANANWEYLRVAVSLAHNQHQS